MDYLFPIGKENVFLSQHFTLFILPSEFWISILNDRNRPILDSKPVLEERNMDIMVTQ